MVEENPKNSRLRQTFPVVGKGVWSGTKNIIYIAGRLAHPIGKAGGKLALKGGQATINYGKHRLDERAKNNVSLDTENFYEQAASRCEQVVDALLIEKPGTSARIVRTLSVKFGAAGATAGVFSIASLLGTASTGTAIATLHGAAFQGAALAWIGGNVAVGGMVVGGIAVAGGLVAYFGAQYAITKFAGKRRKKKHLNEHELRVIDTCLFLATSFRQQLSFGRSLDPTSASALHTDTFVPLCDALDECLFMVSHWPKRPHAQLEKKIGRTYQLKHYLRKTVTMANHRPGMIGIPITTGVISATIIKLVADDLPGFNQKEELVLDALRRSKTTLNSATNEELSTYVQTMDIEQMRGLKNNVKGIYLELAFQSKENTDGDAYIVELFEATNHPGADARIINTDTGDVVEIQLKATNYIAHIRAHNEKHGDIKVFATSEVADEDPIITSAGFSNDELSSDTEQVLAQLQNPDDGAVLDSLGVAAMVTLARNAGLFLKGQTMSVQDKETMIKEGVVAASVAGLVQLLI